MMPLSFKGRQRLVAPRAQAALIMELALAEAAAATGPPPPDQLPPDILQVIIEEAETAFADILYGEGGLTWKHDQHDTEVMERATAAFAEVSAARKAEWLAAHSENPTE